MYIANIMQQGSISIINMLGWPDHYYIIGIHAQCAAAKISA